MEIGRSLAYKVMTGKEAPNTELLQHLSSASLGDAPTQMPQSLFEFADHLSQKIKTRGIDF